MIDVLNLEWTAAPLRDRVMATLVCNYLRLQGFSVEERSVFDGFQAIHHERPKLFFITNTTGAQVNLELMQYAKSRGCIGVSLISEGNFIGDEENHIEMLWGWNKRKVLNEDLYLLWSERTRSIALHHHPELAGKVAVSGGVGFDNYLISETNNSREDFLSLWGKKGYTRVVGIGCFDFGPMYQEDYRHPIVVRSYSKDEIQRFRNDGIEFNQILLRVAESNSDILFLVKKHPGEMLGDKASATNGLSKLRNVIMLKNEASIFECIEQSDFWVTYESTTALETWLLGKQTCLLNPSGRDFPRDRLLSQGSPAYESVEHLNEAIRCFYAGGMLPGFAEREESRHQIIKEIIQWDDGLNHVRAGNAIIDMLLKRKPSTWRQERWGEKVNRWKQHTKWMLGPILRKSTSFSNSYANRRNFPITVLENYQKSMLTQQEAFYRSKGLLLDELRQVRVL